MDLLNAMNKRYATKLFEKSKKVDETLISELMESTNLSPSSFGLQPFRIVRIQNDQLRQRLREVSWNQPQITDSSDLFIFCSKTEIDKEFIDKFVHLIAETRGLNKDDLNQYLEMMSSFVLSMPEESRFSWMSRQTYLALGTMITSAAVLGLDACPMEGFDKNEYDKILGLNQKGLTSLAVLAVGYRDENDNYSKMKKVRIPLDKMFINM
ncbi:MAG: NAD(P)H-dependent oxidoreductase [Candidatus Delongbacteria bacterium]|nr:NAD(P)H-dependent oxidoreductase [Candidatus Delongbacteria bacterium]MBN2833785.1 NAD(P)H-dependent oxidoreductase [Candidatus Delongbacteria bacterium]